MVDESNIKNNEEQKNENIKIIIDVPEGVTGIINYSNRRKNMCTPFYGLDGLGQPYRMFGKVEMEDTYEDMIYKYSYLHPNLSAEEIEALKARMHENIPDVSVYRALCKYDNKNQFKDDRPSNEKLFLYLEAMLRPITPEEGEKYDDFKKREIQTRQNELKEAGISITYDFGNYFSRNIELSDLITVIQNSRKNKNYAKVRSSVRDSISKITDKIKSIFKPTEGIKKLNDNFNDAVKEIITKDEEKKRKTQELKAEKKEAIKTANIKKEERKKTLNTKKNEEKKKVIKTFTVNTEKIGKTFTEVGNNLKEKIKNIKIKEKSEKAKHYFSQNKIMPKLREMSQNNSKIRRKLALSVLLSGGMIVAGFTSSGVIYSQMNDENQISGETITASADTEKPAKVDIESLLNGDIFKQIDIDNEIDLIESQGNIKDADEETSYYVEDENVLEKEEAFVNLNSDIQSEEEQLETVVVEKDEEMSKAEEIISQITDTESSISVKDLLLATLDIDFDTEFKINNGKYYAGPDGSGNFGTYEKVDSTVKVNIVDAIKDGRLVQYKIDSGMTFSEIEADSEKIISLHTVKSNGQILGWNPDVEMMKEELIRGEMNRISPELSEEEIEFFNNIDINSKVSSHDKEIIEHLCKAKKAQKAVDSKDKTVELDNEEER